MAYHNWTESSEVKQSLGLTASAEGSMCFGWGCPEEDKAPSKPTPPPPMPPQQPTDIANVYAQMTQAQQRDLNRARNAGIVNLTTFDPTKAFTPGSPNLNKSTVGLQRPTYYDLQTIVPQQTFAKKLMGLVFGSSVAAEAAPSTGPAAPVSPSFVKFPSFPGSAPAPEEDKTKLYLGIGAGVLAVAALGYYMTRKR